MGIVWAKLWRKKTNTEVLEKLEKEIRFIEDYGRNTEQKHKKIVGRFLVFSIGLYIVATFLFFFYFFPSNVKERVLYIIPIVLAPFIITCTKKMLTWYYNRKLTKNQKKLVDLRNDKKKLLEQIMETETYKVARTLLEKYAPEQVRKVTIPTGTELSVVKPANSPEAKSDLRNRFSGASSVNRPPYGTIQARASIGPVGSSLAGSPFSQTTPQRPAAPANNQIVPRGISNNQVSLSHSILPRDRSILDRMVEYLVGDGPSNRYALICKNCSGHNGMALLQEFEYISFKCCYCSAFNPSHKKRPLTPKIHSETSPLPSQPSDSSDSEKNSGSDSEPETPPPNTEIETLSSKDQAKLSDTEPTSDFDKLSDIEQKNSDAEDKPEATPDKKQD